MEKGPNPATMCVIGELRSDAYHSFVHRMRLALTALVASGILFSAATFQATRLYRDSTRRLRTPVSSSKRLWSFVRRSRMRKQVSVDTWPDSRASLIHFSRRKPGSADGCKIFVRWFPTLLASGKTWTGLRRR